MAHRIVALLFAVIWLSSSLYAQSSLNFDKTISGTDKMIYIAPPAGKVWVIVQGSLVIERLLPNVTMTVFTQAAPFYPIRNPVTGEMRGCETCVNIIQVDLGRFTFIPIVGGYGTNRDGQVLQGQAAPIVVAYPDRLAIIITPPHGGHLFPFQTWTRLSVLEKDLDQRFDPDSIQSRPTSEPNRQK